MNDRLFGAWGVVQFALGGLLLWANAGQVASFIGVAAFGCLFASAASKVLAGFVFRETTGVRASASVAFVLDGLLLVSGYQFLVDVGTYEARTGADVLAALAAVTMIGIGVGIVRGQVAFPADDASGS